MAYFHFYPFLVFLGFLKINVSGPKSTLISSYKTLGCKSSRSADFTMFNISRSCVTSSLVTTVKEGMLVRLTPLQWQMLLFPRPAPSPAMRLHVELSLCWQNVWRLTTRCSAAVNGAATHYGVNPQLKIQPFIKNK